METLKYVIAALMGVLLAFCTMGFWYAFILYHVDYEQSKKPIRFLEKWIPIALWMELTLYIIALFLFDRQW